MKNILFFLTPKAEVIYMRGSQTAGDALDSFRINGYTALPIIDEHGRYVGTITEGDLLRFCLDNGPSGPAYDTALVADIPRRIAFAPATAGSDIEDLISVAMKQNFVPVVDDNEIFIGIVTRRDIIGYCYGELKKYIGEDR